MRGRELTRFQRISFLRALFKTPGVSLAVLQCQATMLSQLLISVTPLGLGMWNLQAAGNADPVDPGGVSSGGARTSLDGGEQAEMSHHGGSRASPTKLLWPA